MRPKHYISLFIAVVILGGGAYISQKWFFDSFTAAPEQSELATQELKTTYVIPILSEGTVLEAMERLAATSEFSFSGREFPGLGFFVEEIGGRKNGNGYYWTLFINGTLSEEGASSAQVTPRDTVLWRYQKGV